MKIKVNNCCDCGKPCMLFCPLRDDSYEYICDICHEEVSSDELYYYEGKEVCVDCLLKEIPKAYQ